MALGKINYIDDLRTIWKHEEKNFTPWLAQNISLLGEAIGLDLEVVSTEHSVGAFSLDILAKDTNSRNIVAIENQLEITDHGHLGQIMTYASGVDAKTVIWVSKEVREEHRKAVDWLNQITNDDMEFFAVEIQLITIDESQPAPFFNIKASPNDWSKMQKVKLNQAEVITERKEYYHGFFTTLLDMVHKNIHGFTNSKKASYDSWKKFPSGISGVYYSIAYRSGNKFSCELYLDSGDKVKNEQRFDMLLEKKEKIEDTLGELSWERLNNKNACRIAAYIDVTDENEMLAWAIKQLECFKNCFGEYITSEDF